MRSLTNEETLAVSAGMSDLDIFSLTTLGSTALGLIGGAYIATRVTSITNVKEFILLPIWIAAGAGLGAFVGVGIGILAGLGGICAHHMCPVNSLEE